eukprot:jgi/Hompol1/5787/HPOL_004699-RA
MPKIVSRGIVSEYNPDNDDSASGLSVYYCAFCGEYALVVDTPLDHVPSRRTDRARIVDVRRHTLRINPAASQTKLLLQRKAGLERQLRSHCAACNLLVSYAPSVDSQYVYIVDGAVVPQKHQ